MIRAQDGIRHRDLRDLTGLIFLGEERRGRIARRRRSLRRNIMSTARNARSFLKRHLFTSLNQPTVL